MRVRSVLAACTALCCLAWPAGARAAQRDATLVATLNATLGGASLKLEGLCAARVDVSVDPALHDRVAVSVAARNRQEIDRLAFESGAAARVGPAAGLDPACWRPAGDAPFSPTLTVRVAVPPSFGLGLSESGATRFRIGAIGPLSVDGSGSEDIAVDSVQGPIGVSLSGSATLGIGRVESGQVAVENSGSADLRVRSGRIGTLSLQQSGSGTVAIGAAVGDATIDSSGSGGVTLASASGTLTKSVSGSGTVVVGDR